MKKIVLAALAMSFSMSTYAQSDTTNINANEDSLQNQEMNQNDEKRNSRDDSKYQEQNDNSAKQNSVDSAKVRSDEKHSRQKPHSRDSTETEIARSKKSNDNLHKSKPSQTEKSSGETKSISRPVKSKDNSRTEKDKMYLVPDSTLNKNKK